MGWLSDRFDAGADAIRGVGDSYTNIADSAGDFVRAVGRGDWDSAGGDLLAIGWEVGNIISFGSQNAIRDELKDFLQNLLPPIDYADRKAMSRDASSPVRVVYGKTKVGGTVRYFEASGTDSATLHMIVIFAGHSCADIESVYFNGELAFIGTTAQGKFSGKAEMIYETGKQTTANAAIVAATPAGWTNSHKLLGHTYAYFKLSYDNDVYQGVPSISAVVKGKDDIYDPRTLSSGWTDNQALVLRDFLASNYGYGVQSFEEQSFIDGADICDQLVTKGNGQTEKRYTANGAFSIIDSPEGALNAIRGAGVSGIQYVQGVIRYLSGVYSAPQSSAAFSESDIWGGLQIVPTTNTSDRINAIRGTYLDPAQDYEPIDFVPIIVDQYVTADKQELYEDAELPFTDSGTRARRIAKIALERSRFGVRVSCKLSWKAFEYSVGDRIKLSIANLGWVDKVFRIEKMTLSLNGADVELSEDSPQVWSWDESDALAIDVPPALSLPNPLFVSTPTGLTASESLFIANDLKTIRSRITLVWDGLVTAHHYELQGGYEGAAFVALSDYLTAPTFDVDDAQVGAWVFQVRAVNSLGAKSAWASINFTSYGKTAPPADVAGFIGNVRPYSVEFSWQPVPDLDIDFYEIRKGADWDTGEVLQKIRATRWMWEVRPTGTEQAFIRAVDTSGNYSAVASAAQYIIAKPAQVTITSQVIDNNVLLRWTDATTSFAIDKYEVRRGDEYDTAFVWGTVKSTFAAIFETEAKQYIYWVTAIDVAGNTSTPASVVASVDQPPDFVLLLDQAFDLSGGTKSNLISDIVSPEFIADSEEITVDSMLFTADADDALALIGPANTSETWDDHFVNNGFLTPEDQVLAGYPYYLQPTPSAAYFENTLDLLSVIGISRIQIFPSIEILAGAPSYQFTLSYSEDGITFTDSVSTDVVAKNFRYIKVRFDVTSASGQDLLVLHRIGLRLDVKLRTDQGSTTANAADAGGTVVPFNLTFADVQSIVVTPLGTSAIIPVYDFVDAPNPVNFKVLLFNTSGARVSAPFSWTVRGV